ncbi:hypothetical protein SprV_0200638100 [Sparganum proliferum]
MSSPRSTTNLLPTTFRNAHVARSLSLNVGTSLCTTLLLATALRSPPQGSNLSGWQGDTDMPAKQPAGNS